MTDITFMDLTIFLTNVGGILSLVGAAAMAFKPCLHSSLFKEIAKDVQEAKKVEAVNLIYDRLIQARFSYEGVNDLYDRVDEIEHKIYIQNDETSRGSETEADKRIKELETKFMQMQEEMEALKRKVQLKRY